jgi:ribosomal protein S18 acetylase RimI-like enzyme
MRMKIELVTQVTDELCAAMPRLISQLMPSLPAPGRRDLETLLASPVTTLFIARTPDGTIAGMLTLAVFRIPTGMRAWIEDVVVDESVRGQGLGEALCQAAIDQAKARGATSIDLTSRSSREAANRLYARLGFARRDTNYYRLTL